VEAGEEGGGGGPESRPDRDVPVGLRKGGRTEGQPGEGAGRGSDFRLHVAADTWDLEGLVPQLGRA
jgi:hypothetical protein